MRLRIRHILAVALLVGCAYGGMRYEATRIQATCESDSSPTVLNGHAYVCLTAQRAWEIQQALAMRSST
jgi:hypothetical protein